MDPTSALDRRRALSALGAAALCPLVGGPVSARPAEPARPGHSPSLGPGEAWRLLRKGNEYWVGDRLRHPDQSSAHRHRLAEAQHPFAVVVTCIDSRLSPEIVFDQGIGDLFVVRTGAHTLDDLVTGSIEYGPLQDGTPLIVVLGHQRCGAVSAAVSALDGGRRAPGHLADVVEALRPAVTEARRAGGDLVEATVRAQITRTVAVLEHDPALASRVGSGRLGLVGAYYELGTGRLNVLRTKGFTP
ncbi:carbonic anhydrase [Actinocorallia sp. A-T 12471]|uniref:carbonic anhydrase n=1 Tax=Actinocorallia sp. A-T 12471 TaxID=3089813 RepID=UPI0029CC1EEE|nr:carbonic anhydrase [Actinocorallia sp. A-T 12471]MDX6744096.1 carbonic anhydrase [Actinocorallia sp. A-T 12471]